MGLTMNRYTCQQACYLNEFLLQVLVWLMENNATAVAGGEEEGLNY